LAALILIGAPCNQTKDYPYAEWLTSGTIASPITLERRACIRSQSGPGPWPLEARGVEGLECSAQARGGTVMTCQTSCVQHPRRSHL